jgi:GT2 family glycosyltransferase
MPKYSVICCISKPDIFESVLLKSLTKQRRNHDIEIIPIINNDNRYSASNALNVGLDSSRSDYAIVVHQDVEILDDWFTRLDDCIDNLDQDWAVLGSAGIALRYGSDHVGKWGGAVGVDTVAIGSVWHDESALDDEPYWNGIKEPALAHCCDECLMVVDRKKGLRFDSQFHGFHFYGVDICLQARAAGYKVLCADLPIIHYGKYSASMVGHTRYWHYLRFLHNKWKYRFPEMFGTHMHWKKDELTSYINFEMESDDGLHVEVKAMGIKNMQLSTDKKQGFIKYD